MAVPNDGTNANLSLGSIYTEIDQSDYTAFDAEDLDNEDVSLKGLADGTVSGINIANQSSSRPTNQVENISMAEFFEYDHDKAQATYFEPNDIIADFTLSVQQKSGGSTQTGYSDTKEMIVVHPTPAGDSSANDIDFDMNNYDTTNGTLSIAASIVGDPTNSGTDNSATGWVAQGTQATISNVTGGAVRIFIKFRLMTGSAGSDAGSVRVSCNGVQDTFNVTKTTVAAPSDIRLKTNIELLGHSDLNIPIYSFNYKNDLNTTYSGVMAQDLLKMNLNHTVQIGDDGFYRVRYDLIDVDMKVI